jgi:predicted SnoaL-like aldol condensation-catalyzing enzyme
MIYSLIMNTEANKKAALEFQELLIAGKIDEAYEKFVDMSGKHHNQYSAGDFESLKAGMKENEVRFPNKQFRPKHVLADADLVAIHSHIILKEGEVEVAAFHLFRFKDGKIVEMWDCAQPTTEENKNENGFF